MNLELLNEIIRESGISVERLAYEIGMSCNSMYNKLHGKTKFYVEELVKLCDILSISDDNFLKIISKN